MIVTIIEPLAPPPQNCALWLLLVYASKLWRGGEGPIPRGLLWLGILAEAYNLTSWEGFKEPRKLKRWKGLQTAWEVVRVGGTRGPCTRKIGGVVLLLYPFSNIVKGDIVTQDSGHLACILGLCHPGHFANGPMAGEDFCSFRENLFGSFFMPS